VTPPGELVAGYGLYNFSVSEVHRPRTVDELAALVRGLHGAGVPYRLRGNGRSYGDAALNPRGPVLDLSALDQVLALDEETGVLRAQAGATFETLWRHALPRGFWPPIVPGTMHVTLGGALAMNIHGKNGWRRGTLGEHVESLTVLDERGEPLAFRRGDPRLLSVISNFESPRPIVEVALTMKHVETGFVDVEARPTRTLAEALELLDAEKERWEYLVGWLDCFPSGRGLGRGALHFANYHPWDGVSDRGLGLETQLAGRLSDRIPKGLMLAFLRAMAFDSGMRFTNLGKFAVHRLGGTKRYREALVAYSFLLDFVPDWREMYRPGGFIQYQLFIPRERALAALTQAIRWQQELDVVTYLAVLKRHREDRYPGPLANSYVRDGYSLALDFPVTPRNASRLIQLCRRFDALVLENGGGFYRAKDCVGSWERARARAS